MKDQGWSRTVLGSAFVSLKSLDTFLATKGPFVGDVHKEKMRFSASYFLFLPSSVPVVQFSASSIGN